MKLTLKLTGSRPMLMHNGRLANPLDPYTRDLKAISKKRSKTDDDLERQAYVEARGGFWETSDHLIGIPTAAVWRSIYDASKAFKLGEDIKRALSYDDETLPILIGGREWDCDEWLKNGENPTDYRPVKVQRNKVMRARPRIPEGWETTQHFDLEETALDPGLLVPVLERAGSLVGIGDWRPTYGRYSIEVI